MSISLLKLSNFRKHRNTELWFGPATLILGQNGAGKSSIVEALRFALTGSVYGELKDSISVGEDEANIELFCDNGLNIRRKIGKRGSQAELQYGTDSVSGASAVTKYVLDHFDVTEEAIDILLARQEAMCEFFMGTESKRVSMLSSLIPGVNAIKSRYDWLTDALSTYPDYGKVEAVDDNEIANLESKLNGLQIKLNNLRAKRNEAISKQNAAKDRARMEELERLVVVKQNELAEVKRNMASKQFDMDSTANIIAKIEANIKELEPAAAGIEEVEKLRGAYKLVIDDLRSKTAAQHETTASAADVIPYIIEFLVRAMPDEVDSSLINRLAALRADMQHYVQKRSSLQTELAILSNRMAALESEIRSVNARISMFQPIDVDPSEGLDVEQLVAETDVVMHEISKTYEEVIRKRRLSKMWKYQQKRDYINQLRDIFHWRNLSAQASTFVLSSMVDDINEYLDMLEVPFKVRHDSNSMTLSAVFGSSTFPDQLLSGGQRVAVAVAMKLAVLRLLGGKFRFIALDEPTAFLDSARISALRALMRKVADVCRNEGAKLLVISHCDEIQSAFDNVIQIS